MIFVCFSCQKRQTTSSNCVELEKKYDSVLELNKSYDELSFNRFFNVLKKEKKNIQDTILIKQYKDLMGSDSLLDMYIWDRIHTINQNTNQLNAYSLFKGTYFLKPNYNEKYAQVTKIVLDKDSCYLYKSNDLVLKDKFKLVNSSNKYILGKLRLQNFKLSLNGAFKERLIIHLDDNGCLDCQQLQFQKK